MVKRTSKSGQSKIDPELARIRSLLFAEPNLRLGMDAIKRTSTVEQVRKFFDKYWTVPAVRSQIVRTPFPRRLSEIDGRILSTSELDIELAWAILCLRNFSDDLRDFVNVEISFYTAFLSDKLADAAEILDRIESNWGLSRWLVVQRLALLDQSGLSSERKSFVHDLINRGEPNFIGFIGWLNDLKLSQEISRERFWSIAERYISEFPKDSEFEIFLRWVLDPTKTISDQKLAGLLAYDEKSPIIDRYHGLLEVLAAIITSGYQITKSILPDIATLSERIDDERLRTAASILQGNLTPCPSSTEELAIYDAYTRGEYKDAYDRSVKILDQAPWRAHLYEICARAHARTGGDDLASGAGVWRTAVRDIGAVYMRTATHDEALLRLQRLAHSSTVRNVSLATQSFLARENALQNAAAPQRYDALCASLTSTGSTWHWRALDETAQLQSLAAASEAIPTSAAIRLQRSLVAADLTGLDAPELQCLPSGRARIYRGHILRARRLFADAAVEYEAELGSTFLPDRLAAARGATACYRSLSEFENALGVLVPICLDVPSAYRSFELEALLEDIQTTGLPDAYRSVRLSIAYDIYSRNVSTDLDPEKSDAAEEYVFSNAERFPSRLKIPDDDVGRREAVYFLREVCTPRVMDPFMDLDNTSAVELERIAICQRLTEADPENIEIYAEEIRAITRRRIVRERLKQVEQSKIFVDTPNIKRVAEKALKEQYGRLQEVLSRSEYDQNFTEMINALRDVIGERRGLELHFPGRRLDERDAAFAKLCGEIFALLISSPEHGLKTYLSTRIKHGTLAAQLSSPFQVHNLLLEANDSVYGESPYWQRQLYLSAEEANTLHEILSTFSAKIDALLDVLKNEWIQVKGESHPDAWMDFALFKTELLFLQVQVSEDTTFDEFFDLVLARFWHALNDALVVVRSNLESRVKSELERYLNELQADVEALLDSSVNASGLLSSIASARTDMQNSLNVAIGWFKLNQGSERPDYDFEIAADVAVESINSCFKSRPLTAEREIDVSRELRGPTLESIVDVLFILFENAITHSHGAMPAPVRLRAEGAGEILLLEVENKVAAVVDATSINAELKERLDRLKADGVQGVVSREGGSGFPKIIKILKHDLNSQGDVDARFVDSETFRVNITIQSGGLFV